VSSTARTGRRKGVTKTREAIAAAARHAFAELGYDRATIRTIARSAGVDPALVVHFFGPKDALFVEVMASPVQSDAMARLAEEDRSTIGRRLAELVMTVMEDADGRAILLGRIRAASTEPAAVELVRETVVRNMAPLTAALTDDQPERRAALVGAHVVGIALARYVVEVEPLVEMTPEELVDALAPTFQRYLVEPLS
jgi:AcrR family transcriptional regulator